MVFANWLNMLQKKQRRSRQQNRLQRQLSTGVYTIQGPVESLEGRSLLSATITGFSTDTGASANDNITNDNTLVISGTATSGNLTITVYDGATNLGTAKSAAADPFGWTFETKTLASGVHTFTATASDAPATKSEALVVTIDTTAPSAPSILTGAVGADPDNDKVTLSGTVATGSSVKIFQAGVAIGDAVVSGGNWTFTSGELADGSYAFTAKASDVAGNTSGASSTKNVTVDADDPAAPTGLDLATADDNGKSTSDNITSLTTGLSISGTGEKGATVTLFDDLNDDGVVDKGETLATKVLTSTTFTVDVALAAGSHLVKALQTDAGGHVSPASDALEIIVDTAAETPTGLDLAADDDTNIDDDNITSQTTGLTITGSGEEGATVTLFADADNDGVIDSGETKGTGTVVDGAFSIDVALAAGTHNLKAKQTDLANNVSAASEALVVIVDTSVSVPAGLDLAAADDTGTSSTDNKTRATSELSISGSGEVGATVQLLAGGVEIAGATGVVGNDGKFSIDIDLSAEGDGSFAITATQTDLAGNVSKASAALSLTIDTVGPEGTPSDPDLATADDTGAATDDNITRKTSGLTITGSGSTPGNTVTVFEDLNTDGVLDIGEALASGTVAAGGTYAIDIALPEGEHTINVAYTDVAGNGGTSANALVIVVDTTAAAPTKLDLAAANDTNIDDDNITSETTALGISGKGEDGATVTLFDDIDNDGVIDGGETLATIVVPGGGDFDTTVDLAAGTHRIKARQTDVAGNASAISSVLTIVVDPAAAAPTGLDLAALDDTGSSNSDNVTQLTDGLTISGSAEVGATVQLQDGGSDVGDPVVVGATGKFSINLSLAEGDHSLTAIQTDLAGNVSDPSATLNITVDTTAADTPTLDGFSDDSGTLGDFITSDTTLTLSGTALANEVITVSKVVGEISTSLGTAKADGDGNWSLTTDALAAGEYSFTATASDAAGNESVASEALTVTIDTTPPAVPVITTIVEDSGSSATDLITNDQVLTVSGTADKGVTITVRSGTDIVGTTLSDELTGAWSLDTSELEDGTHKLTATSADAAGNESAASTSKLVTVDSTPPAPPTITGFSSDTGTAGDNITSDTTLTLSGTGEVGTSVAIYQDAGAEPIDTVAVTAGGTWTFTTDKLEPDGVFSFTAVGTDLAGNESTVSTALDVTVDSTAPTVDTLDFDAITGIATLTFSEAVSGVDLADFSLTRNGATISLTGLTVTTADNTTFELDLTGKFATAGDYVLSLNAKSAGIADAAGNALVDGGSTQFAVDGYVLEILSNKLTLTDSGTGASNDLTLEISGTGTSAALVIKDAAEVIDVVGIAKAVSSDGGKTVTVPLSAFSGGFVFNAGNGDDSVTIDFATTVPVPTAGLTFNGGDGTDSLNLLNVSKSKTFTSETFNYTNATDGSIVLGGSTSRTISYTGLNPITNTGTPANVTFNLTAEADDVTLENDAGQGKLSAATIETTNFDMPAAGGSITINLGAGEDSLTITSLALNETTSLTINGQADADSVTFSATGGLTNVKNLTVSAETIGQTEAISVVGTSTFTAGAGGIDLSDAGNDFNSVSATATADVPANDGAISIYDTNDLTVGAVSGKGVTITADDALNLNAAINGGSGTIAIAANADGTDAQGLTMSAASSITTTNASASAVSIFVNMMGSGEGSAKLSSISANTTTGVVTIDAGNGAILDNNGAGVNVTAFSLAVSGLAGVGTALDAIETNVDQLSGAGGAGGIFITEASNLAINDPLVASEMVPGTGAIRVTTTNGSLTVNAAVTADGAVTLIATEGSSADNDVTVGSTGAVTSNTGDISLQAGDDVTLDAGSALSAEAGAISISGDVGSNETAGTTITVAGTLTSLTGSTVTGGLQNDNYAFTYQDGGTFTGAVTVVDGGGASDRVVINGTTGNDDLFVTSQEDPADATTDRVSRGTEGNEAITLSTGIDALTLNGDEGEDSFTVQPSSLFATTIDGGDPEPGDSLTLDALGNSFQIAGNTISVSGGAPAFKTISFTNVSDVDLGPVSTSPAQRFDFNAPVGKVQSATQSDFIGVLPTDLYVAAYGWDVALSSFNLTTVTGNDADLLNDGHFFTGTTTRTFTTSVDNGLVMATITYGGSTALDGLRIRNRDTGSVLASGLSTSANTWNHVTVIAEVTDGTLDLQFDDTVGTSRRVALSSLDVRPLNLDGLNFATDDSYVGDGATVDKFSINNGPDTGFITVSTTAGTIVGTDASAKLAGFQVETDGTGVAELSIRRPGAPGTAAVSLSTPTGEALGYVTIDYTGATSKRFDFNTAASLTADPAGAENPDGYFGVKPTDLYSDATGFGWLANVTGASTKVFGDQAAKDATDTVKLVSDSATGSTAGTFRVALEDGDYDVHLYMGDASDHQKVSVVANGQTVVSKQALTRNTIFETTFPVTVANGQLNLVFSQNSTSGNKNWVVNGLEIIPSGSQPGTITAPAPVLAPADGTTVTEIVATTDLTAGTLVTVATSKGTITSIDASALYAGTQVAVAGGGTITFTLKSPMLSGDADITWRAVDGSALELAPANVTFDLGSVVERNFDFNNGTLEGATTPTADGFVSVRANQKTPATDGFGWLTSPTAFDTANQKISETVDGKTVLFGDEDAKLYRDGHAGTANSNRTFRFAAADGASYDLVVYLGRQSLLTDNVFITVEGKGEVAVPANVVGDWFQEVAISGATDDGTGLTGSSKGDGFIDVKFEDRGGTRRTGWVVNGLTVETVAPPILATVTSTAAETRAVTISNSDVASVVASLGVNPSAVNVVVINLGGARLGHVVGHVVYVDDDGAGLGWSTQLAAVDAGRYDLASVVAHELGHLIGLDHSASGPMQSSIAPGERLIDAAFVDLLSDALNGLS